MKSRLLPAARRPVKVGVILFLLVTFCVARNRAQSLSASNDSGVLVRISQPRDYQAITSTFGASQVNQSPAKQLAAQKLCEQLSEVKTLPFKGEPVSDVVYNGLMVAGDDAIPCLIDKITDTSRMKDPRQAPSYGDVRVGDVAFFILGDITGVPFEQMLPEAVRSELNDSGVYAYFEYVERYENRQELQGRWREWRGQSVARRR